MTQWRIRDLQPTDLDGFLRLWEEYTAAGVEPVYSLNEVLASTRADTAVVAVVGDEVVGATVARAAHDQAWIVFFAVDARWRRRGISGAMLSAVERRLASQGIHRVSVLVPDGEEHVGSLTRAGFADKRHLRYFERTIPIRQEEVLVLRELGGRMLGRDRWDSIGGMRHEKQVLERRLVLPLADPDLADQFGVVPPRAIVLFGPPGTGKTTFAKGIASRLEWPFVEVFPSRLAASPKGLAGELRETFEKIDDLDHAVVFIDEVEEIAVRRGGEPPSPMQGVTNELLKIIPAFRDKPGRLLICATNFIRALDPAFLRHDASTT
jgi:GNAT superfamily N-acetyltransferase